MKPLKPSGPGKSVARVAALSQEPAAKPSAIKPPAATTGASAPRRQGLSDGAKAPAFRLPRDGGDHVSLADFAGKKLVLFFYPRADTPGCTREAIDFTRLSAAFAAAGTAVLGVSADPLKAQEPFATSTSSSLLLLRMRHMRCWRPMAPGAKNPCTARPSWAFFAPRF